GARPRGPGGGADAAGQAVPEAEWVGGPVVTVPLQALRLGAVAPGRVGDEHEQASALPHDLPEFPPKGLIPDLSVGLAALNRDISDRQLHRSLLGLWKD